MSNARKNTAAIAGAIAALTALATAACTIPSTSVKNTADNPKSAGTAANAPSTPGPKSASTNHVASASTTAPRLARTGDSITLSGHGDEKISVTVVKVVDKTSSTNEFMTPDAGKHYAAVQFRIANAGTVSFSDAPDNDVKVLDADGQAFTADFATTTAGPELGTTVTLAPGDSQLGYVTFQVPDDSTIAKVQFTIDSGFGSTAQWSIR